MASPKANPSPDRPSGPNRRTRRDEQFGRAYVGIPEAATYLDSSEKTVRRLIAAKRLPAYRLGNRVLKVKIADLDSVFSPVGGTV